MAEIQRWNVTEPYVQMKCGLGEAPFYETTTNSLRFVDINKQRLHIVDLEKGPSSLKSYDLGTPVSTSADIEGNDDDIIVGAKLGYATMNRNTKKLEYIKKVWPAITKAAQTNNNAKTTYRNEKDELGKEERMRCNDGFVDLEGRYFVGTMNDPKVKVPSDEGVLFRLDPDLTLHRLIENVTIPNGMGLSLDERTMYFIDSPTMAVWKFKYERKTGDISDRQVFYHFEGDAVPDGMAMDVNGCLWVAMNGDGKVLKLSPEAEIVGEIYLPARMVACPAFAGDVLYITSAEEEEPEGFPESAKHGGSLFRVHVGVEGLPVHKFRL